MPDGQGGAARAAFVSFDQVSVVYGTKASEFLALDRASLNFATGNFVCLVGPSGCGKTTLLQTLAGFLVPTSGAVTIEALFPWLTVAANAGFGPMVLGVGRAARAETVERLLRTVGLWEFRDRYPYQLSGGMQQRLAIVRALANGPKILLMDEPFGALDALTREKMQEELHAIWRRTGMTVLFITHSVEEAVYLGTEVVVMSPRPGRILERIAAPFARRDAERGSRAIKSLPEFVALRERVLSLIWQTGQE